MICKGLTLHQKNCNKKCILNTDYCIIHFYMNDYTEEQKQNLTLCNTCYKFKHIETGGTKCDRCIEEMDRHIQLCAIEMCKNRKSDLNEFCIRHQLFKNVQNAEHEGKRLCANFIKLQCPNLLDVNDQYRSCEECRKRGKNKIAVTTYKRIFRILEPNVIEKRCGSCQKKLPVKLFTSAIKGGYTSVCQICRDKRSARYHDLKNKYNPSP
jgi:hypothetical protein